MVNILLIIIWLVVSTYPSEKWWSESQLGWWNSLFWMENPKIPWFQTTNQYLFFPLASFNLPVFVKLEPHFVMSTDIPLTQPSPCEAGSNSGSDPGQLHPNEVGKKITHTSNWLDLTRTEDIFSESKTKSGAQSNMAKRNSPKNDSGIWCPVFFSQFCVVDYLVGGFNLPLWKIWVKVSWDDEIPNWLEK